MDQFLPVFKFVAAHYAFVGLLALLSYLYGYRLTRRVVYDSTWEEVAVSVSLGLGIVGMLVFFFGLFKLLYPSVVISALLIGLIACYPVIPETLARLKKANPRAKLLLVAGVLVLSVPVLVLPLYPPKAFDATMYFLTSAKVYAQSHQILFTPYLRLPVLPQLNEMLFTLALVLYDDIAAQLIQLLMLATLCLGLVAVGRRNFSKQAGWWAAAILLGNSVVIWVGTVAYLDISLMLFSSMSAYTFWNWLQTRKVHWLVLAGTFCGFAAGTKYPGLFFPMFFGIVTVYIAIRERKFIYPVYLAAATIVTGAPWYIRNYYHTRNPVFPFMSQIFGYTFWTAEDVKGLVADMQLYGVGRSIPALFSLPWHLAFNQDIFLSEGLRLTPIFFFALPLIIIFSFKSLRLRQVLLFAIAFVLFWAFSSQVLRFILPAVPVMSVAAAAALDMTLGSIPLVNKLRGQLLVVIILCGFLAYGGWVYSAALWQANGPVPVTQGQRDTYLTERLPSYPAHKILNRLKGSNYTLYAMQDENMAYYVDGVYKGDYFGPARYARIWPKLTDGKSLYNELKSLGADYFLVNNQRLKIDMPADPFFQTRFKPIYEGGTVRLFELSDTPFERTISNTLLNADFEDLKMNRPEGWQMSGDPVVETSGKSSFSGSVSIHCDQAGDVVYQTMSTTGGTNYFFGCHSRAAGSGQAKLQVNWSDSEGTLLREDFKVIEPGKEWKRYEISFQAPQQSTTATIYASPLDPSSVWFDKCSFGEVKFEAKP